MYDFFSHVTEAPSDPILGLSAAFLADPRPDKVNLSVGVYQTEEGKIPVLRCVKDAEDLLLKSESSKNYLPIDGDPIYLEEVARLVLGQKLYTSEKASFSLVQTLGGSGGLRLGAEFLKQYLSNPIYISDPSWPNHKGIFTQCGLPVLSYPYYDFTKKEVAFEKMVEFLSTLSPRSVVLFHVSCHNPSGSDLNKDQWRVLADLCLSRELIPFFDAAYLGFHSSFEEDSFPIRLFVEKGIEFLLTVSFSKNFSLYAERIGAFFFFSNPSTQPKILSQLKILVRRNYSNPPLHGAKIIATILKTPQLKMIWDLELNEMKVRISALRSMFVSQLSMESPNYDYSYLLNKAGLFCFYELSKEQVALLIQKHGIYMTSDGRMNVVGINSKNRSRVVKALLEVSR